MRQSPRYRRVVEIIIRIEKQVLIPPFHHDKASTENILTTHICEDLLRRRKRVLRCVKFLIKVKVPAANIAEPKGNRTVGVNTS
jgi:hypothetical protein